MTECILGHKLKTGISPYKGLALVFALCWKRLTISLSMAGVFKSIITSMTKFSATMNDGFYPLTSASAFALAAQYKMPKVYPN